MWIRIELVPELQTNHVDCMYIVRDCMYIVRCSTTALKDLCLFVSNLTIKRLLPKYIEE